MFDGVKEILEHFEQRSIIFSTESRAAKIELYHKNFYKTLMQHELLFSIFPYQELDNQAHLKQKNHVLNAGNIMLNLP